MDDFSVKRATMVVSQLKERGINDTAVLRAMNTVPREAFVVKAHKEHAELKREHRVLEIGTGSGYAAAVLGQIAGSVYTVERHQKLIEYAQECLLKVGGDNIYIHHGDGTQGWPKHAPYDGIIVAAGGPSVPEALRQQLAVGGHLVMPVGPERRKQTLYRITRLSSDRFRKRSFGAVAFVPLVGTEGWDE